MSLTRFQYHCVLKVCFIIFVPYIFAVPVPASESFYHKFINSLVGSNCEMPKTVSLPFSDLSDTKHFSYLSDPLIQCQTPEAVKADVEAHLLCQETFEVLQNVTCSNFSVSLPEIVSARNFRNVCEEFSSMKDVLPKKEKYLSGRLVDTIVCKLLCSDKFESLCQTLLWSHDVQLEIKKAVDTGTVEDKKVQSDVPKNDVEDIKSNMKNVIQEPILDQEAVNNQNLVEVNNDNIEANSKKDSNGDLENNNLATQTSLTVKSVDSSVTMKNNARNETQKIVSATDLSNVFQSRIVLPQNVSLNKQEPQKVDLKGSPSKNNNDKVSAENNTTEQNHAQTENQPVNNDADKTAVEKQSSTLVPEKSKAATAGKAQDFESNKSSTPITNDGTEAEPDTLPLPRPEENGVNVGSSDNQKKEQTAKQNNPLLPQNDKEKNVEKPNEAITSVLEKVTIDTSFKESSTLQAYPDQIVVEDPDDRDSEQYYNDTENEDYPKSEYESTLNDLKARKPVVKSSVVSEVANPNDDVQNNYDLLNRNSFGRGQEYTPMISSFPEQEDGHFFFYFLSIVLILMAGYLLVHNKQKIIALIIEGRHERRRRSHGAGYKKLDTK